MYIHREDMTFFERERVSKLKSVTGCNHPNLILIY